MTSRLSEVSKGLNEIARLLQNGQQLNAAQSMKLASVLNKASDTLNNLPYSMDSPDRCFDILTKVDGLDTYNANLACRGDTLRGPSSVQITRPDGSKPFRTSAPPNIVPQIGGGVKQASTKPYYQVIDEYYQKNGYSEEPSTSNIRNASNEEPYFVTAMRESPLSYSRVLHKNDKVEVKRRLMQAASVDKVPYYMIGFRGINLD
jgi:hypothetical protein